MFANLQLTHLNYILEPSVIYMAMMFRIISNKYLGNRYMRTGF